MSVSVIVFATQNTLDVAFDAGGKVNVGLTATTIVSQWTWAATLLQSSTVASKVIKARFGSTTHKIFCGFALMTNVIVTSMLMLGGAAVLTSLIKGISLEYATMLGSCDRDLHVYWWPWSYVLRFLLQHGCFIYNNAHFLITVYGDPDNEENPLGEHSRGIQFLQCSPGPDGNENSYLTMVSKSGLMFGLINIVGNFGTVFVDQAYWQSCVAAKPKQGVMGFLLGGLTWFAIPFALATTTGLAYIALSTQQGAPLLTDADVDAGLVPPVVAQRLLGKTGEILITLMILMAVTSTGSAEVMAVTSILVTIYTSYI
ncbi:hypothetical protein ScPMuIL_008765 [Solemya velum]